MSEANGEPLPPGWARAQLGSLVEPRSGKANPQATPAAKFIGMEQVEPHTMRLLGTIPCGTMKSGANTFQPFDVLYGRMRAYLNKVYQPDFSGLCSGEFIVLPETGAVLGRFLKYRLNSGDFVRFANHLNSGDRPRVDFDQIKIFNLLLPPKPEQQRIADALDELFSDLDAGVAALERVQAKLKHYRAAVLKAAVEGTLTAGWRARQPTAEPASDLLARILAERRRRWEKAQLQKFKEAGKTPPNNWKAKYREPVAPDTTNLPPLAEGWCWTNLDSLIVNGLQNGAYYPGERYGSGTHILRIDDYQNDWVRNTSELRQVSADKGDIDYYTLHEGDLVINRVNSMTHIGKCLVASKGLEGCLFESNMMRSCLAILSVPRFIEAYLHSCGGRQRLIKGAKWAVNQASINQQDVKRTAVPLPPLAEQAAIVEAVEDQLSVIDHLEADIEAKLKSAQALRQSILRHAFTGRLVPQDPNDEPAAGLLKRIAADRAERARLLQQTKINRATRVAPKQAKR
jgi:type I restriction enzyme S subunit